MLLTLLEWSETVVTDVISELISAVNVTADGFVQLTDVTHWIQSESMCVLWVYGPTCRRNKKPETFRTERPTLKPSETRICFFFHVLKLKPLTVRLLRQTQTWILIGLDSNWLELAPIGLNWLQLAPIGLNWLELDCIFEVPWGDFCYHQVKSHRNKRLMNKNFNKQKSSEKIKTHSCHRTDQSARRRCYDVTDRSAEFLLHALSAHATVWCVMWPLRSRHSSGVCVDGGDFIDGAQELRDQSESLCFAQQLPEHTHTHTHRWWCQTGGGDTHLYSPGQNYRRKHVKTSADGSSPSIKFK